MGLQCFLWDMVARSSHNPSHGCLGTVEPEVTSTVEKKQRDIQITIFVYVFPKKAMPFASDLLAQIKIVSRASTTHTIALRGV